jgi:hypothetical protein
MGIRIKSSDNDKLVGEKVKADTSKVDEFQGTESEKEVPEN